MPNIISIINQKGGVGKTTTSLHLAFGFARLFPEKKVLLLDLDAQGNATNVLLSNAELEKSRSIYHVLESKKITGDVLHNTDQENFQIIPSHIALLELENQLTTSIDGFFRLSDALNSIKNEFEYILIDCPPSLSAITINSMIAANGIIIPLQTSKFSIDGIKTVSDAVESIRERYNPYLKILGALLTFYDSRTTIASAMLPEIQKHIHVFESKISKSVAVEEAHLLKKNLFEYAPKNRVTKQYQNLVKEVDDVLRRK